MRITALIASPPKLGTTWPERWEGPDKGLIQCWLRGIEKALESPELGSRAMAGELPTLAWKGGADKPIKDRQKVGSHNYLATWQGLRGEDLDIEQGCDLHMTCSRTGRTFVYTDDIQRLAQI